MDHGRRFTSRTSSLSSARVGAGLEQAGRTVTFSDEIPAAGLAARVPGRVLATVGELLRYRGQDDLSESARGQRRSCGLHRHADERRGRDRGHRTARLPSGMSPAWLHRRQAGPGQGRPRRPTAATRAVTSLPAFSPSLLQRRPQSLDPNNDPPAGHTSLVSVGRRRRFWCC